MPQVKNGYVGFAIMVLNSYQGGMLRSVVLIFLLVWSLSCTTTLHAADPTTAATPAFTNAPALPIPPAPSTTPAPSENRYDVLSKMITPMAAVLLGGTQSENHALSLKASVGQVAGRLPTALQGATFTVKIEYPGRVRLDAPAFGESLVVCRDGNQVWAIPGSKIQFLLHQFQHKPRPQAKNGAPLALPFTSQQAVLLPALFQLENSSAIADIGGTSCRVISGGLIPEIGKATKAEDFSAKLWVSGDYNPKRIDIRRSDFAMSFLIEELTYTPSLPSSTWQPPEGATDIYRCDAAHLDELLYVVMNSLQTTASDKPWMNEAPSPLFPQTPQVAPVGPVQ